MKNKKKIRDRPIDNKKAFYIIKDLAKEKIKASGEKLSELNDIETNLHKVLVYYEKRKKIEIPKAKIINTNNDKNNTFKNYYVNNNIIYSNENPLNLNSHSNEYKLNYKLSEYNRPNTYIIYSTEEKNKVNLKKKNYEIKEADLLFLKIRDIKMKPEEFENIIIDLENKATNDKEDKIDEEKARSIIEKKYSNYKSYADAIINHYKDRRKTLKNSLLRKKWKKNKTFQKRRNEKIKTRKNMQNLEESLNKIIEAQTLCKNNVLPILNNLSMKEKLNKYLLKINEYIFMSEYDKMKNIKIPENRLKEHKILKENIENCIKNLNHKETLEKNINVKKQSEEFNNIKSVTINNNNINHNINNNINHNNNNNINHNIKNNINHNINNNINHNINNNRNINNNNNISNTKTNDIKQENVIEKKINSIYSRNSKNNNNGIETNNQNLINENDNENDREINSNISIENIFPPLSLDILKNTKSNNDTYSENKTNKYRVRIRVNRTNNITIDRYIQLKEDEDLNPFHDSFNKLIDDYKKYSNDEFYVNPLEKKNFENLYGYYNLNKVKDLQLDESDDDSTCLNNDLKQFSTSYKQFLKSKRSHT